MRGAEINSMERRELSLREARRQREKAEIAARLRPVCLEMTPEDFETLVDRIAEVNLRFAQRNVFGPDTWGPDNWGTGR